MDPDVAEVELRRRTIQDFSNVIAQAFPDYPRLQVCACARVCARKRWQAGLLRMDVPVATGTT